MKKLAIILSTVLSLSFSLDTFGVSHWLYCTPSGQAWIMDPLGNAVPAGGCAGGPWAFQLDFVVPTGNPSIPEASAAIYDALNTPPSNPSATPTSAELEEIQTAISNSPITVWVNPLKLTPAAYALIYGGTANLPLFYAYTSINSSTSNNSLALYSNIDRDITVTYKTLDLTVISTEEISVLQGSNSRALNTASLANGTYIVTVSTSENYAVNLTLNVNH